MCYASLALVTDYDCWRESTEDVSVESILAVLAENSAAARRALAEAVARVDPDRGCGCRDAMRFGIITDRAAIPDDGEEAPRTHRREVPVRARRAHRRHGLGGLRLPDDVSGPVHRAPDPGPACRASRSPSSSTRCGGCRAAAGPTSPTAWRCSASGPCCSPRPAPTPPSTATGWRARVSTCRACASSDDLFTASFFVSTDQDQNQLASFYTGAMARARELPLSSLDPADDRVRRHLAQRSRRPWRRYAADCRRARDPVSLRPEPAGHAALRRGDAGGLPGRGDPDRQRLRVRDPRPEDRPRRSRQLQAEVPVLIVTHGPDGSTIHAAERRREPSRRHAIPAARVEGEAVDPTGVGDMYRAGLLRGRRIGAPVARGRPDRQHQRHLRSGGPGPAAAALHARRVPRSLPPQLRRHARARPPVRLSTSSRAFGYNSPFFNERAVL